MCLQWSGLTRAEAPPCEFVPVTMYNSTVALCMCVIYSPTLTMHLSCSYLEGNTLTSVPRELAALKQLSLVYVAVT